MVNIPVVFSFDSRIILGASVAIKSLIDSAKDSTTYDIRIFHSDLDIENQKNITKIVENTRHSIAFHYINPDIFKGAPHNNKSWTELVYYRLIAPNIIKEYDKIIYSDVDVLFKGDLQEVYNLDLTGYEIAAVPVELNREGKMICHKYFPENKKDRIYISSFIVMNVEEMRKQKTVDKVFEVIKTVNNRLKFYDLDTMNIACDKILPISFTYGTFQSIMYTEDLTKAYEYKYLKEIYTIEQLEEIRKNPVMVHYAGGPGKPWRMKNPYPDYKEYMDKLPKSLKQFTIRDIRKKFFSKV